MKILFALSASLGLLLSQALIMTNESNRTRDEIPTVAFCEMVKNAHLYFNRPIRIKAIYSQADEGAYLIDESCPLSHDDQIGVGNDIDEEQREHNRKMRSEMVKVEYGGQAIVTLTGMLRNVSRRDFAWYRYRFDIISFESVSHVTIPYSGELQAGTTYTAAVRGDKSHGIALVIPLRRLEHYAVRIEWANLKNFPELTQMSESDELEIEFSVISDDIKQMTERRWNRTIRCKIIRVR